MALLDELKQELGRADAVSRAEVHPAFGLAPMPALLVQGPHEVLVDLAPELRRRATVLAQSSKLGPAYDPCGRPGAGDISEPLDQIRAPQLIVWGATESENTKEEL